MWIAIILASAIFTFLYGLTGIVVQMLSYIKIPEYSKTIDATLWLLSSILFGLFYYLTH
jgi:hypothetical protein